MTNTSLTPTNYQRELLRGLSMIVDGKREDTPLVQATLRFFDVKSVEELQRIGFSVAIKPTPAVTAQLSASISQYVNDLLDDDEDNKMEDNVVVENEPLLDVRSAVALYLKKNSS